jgi:hypothetical protein
MTGLSPSLCDLGSGKQFWADPSFGGVLARCLFSDFKLGILMAAAAMLLP